MIFSAVAAPTPGSASSSASVALLMSTLADLVLLVDFASARAELGSPSARPQARQRLAGRIRKRGTTKRDGAMNVSFRGPERWPPTPSKSVTFRDTRRVAAEARRFLNGAFG